jgi:hypothetical protein
MRFLRGEAEDGVVPLALGYCGHPHTPTVYSIGGAGELQSLWPNCLQNNSRLKSNGRLELAKRFPVITKDNRHGTSRASHEFEIFALSDRPK